MTKKNIDNTTLNEREPHDSSSLIFLENRILFMEGDFDEENCARLKKELLHLAGISPDPILLYISSYGGSVYSLLSLTGIIKSMKNTLVTVANGYCMSAGSYLYLLGDERYATPDTRFMLHELKDDNAGSLHEVKINFKECLTLQNILNDIVKKNTNIENIDEWLKEDKFLTPKEAFKLGIVTSMKKFIPTIKEKKKEEK